MSELRLGIDVGGSGVKFAVVDTQAGVLVTNRGRIETPDPATPEAVTEVIADIIGSTDAEDPIGIGFPAVLWDGEVFTASNIDKTWIGQNAKDSFESATGRRVTVINDADAAGVAESTFGAAKGVSGLVVTITFGTGIGSGAIFDGELVPNLELGMIELCGHHPAEVHFSAKARKRDDLTWETWGDRVNTFLTHVNSVLNPQMLVLGGGVTKHWQHFADFIDKSLPVVPAAMGNNAGVIGAAFTASRAASTRRTG